MGAAWLMLPLACGCKANDVTHGVASAGSSAVHGVASAAGGVPSLVNVNLSNVLNDLSVNLHLDRANIPINAQIPITIAANVCGVSINILSVSTGGKANCTATTSSPELAQVVQQQIAAGGSVGGGAQGGSTAGTSGAGAAGSGAASGSAGTTTRSSGTTQTQPAGTTRPTGTTATPQPAGQPEPAPTQPPPGARY
jgi:hypothetical protein